MKLLITGSGGFIGGSIGRLAARAGHELLGIGLSSQPDKDWPGKHVRADVSCADLSGVIQKFQPDVLLHAAGPASVDASFETPAEDLRTALLTLSHVLDSVRRSGLSPLVVFPSSAAVYGNPENLPVSEQGAIAPISPYGFHKAACELLAREYSRCFDLDILVCRFFSIFGAGQRRLLIWELYEQLDGASPTIWLEGTGRETRDYLDIEDAGTAVLQLAAALLPRRSHSECLAVNIARGEETNVFELARQLSRLVDPHREIRCRGLARRGDPQRWCADISLLKSLIPAWQPKTLEQSLAECVAAWKNGAGSRPHHD
jgi:UDP-glucose 4-epimerase